MEDPTLTGATLIRGHGCGEYIALRGVKAVPRTHQRPARSILCAASGVRDMVTYEITATGPKGHQVIAISPELQGVVVGDFCSLQAAEEFAARMREIDANVHSVANPDLPPSASRP